MGNWALSAAIAALVLQVHAQIPDQPLQSSQPQQTYPYPDQPVQSWPAPDQPVQSYPDQPDQTYPAPDQPYATNTAPAQSSPIGSSDGSSGCACIGLDYTNGGSYLLDGNSDDLFTFNSAFEGCDADTIIPILVAPNGQEYSCSAINTQPDDTDQASECDISFSQMDSGNWSVIIQSSNIGLAIQRTFELNAGDQQYVQVTATPTIIVGVTSTTAAVTLTNVVYATETLILAPGTTSEVCDGQTQTVAVYLSGTTTTVYDTISRWTTNGALTRTYQTTLSQWAYCHWPSTWVPPQPDVTPPVPPQPSYCRECQPWYTGGGWTWTSNPPPTTQWHPTHTLTRPHPATSITTWPWESPPAQSTPGLSYTTCHGVGPCTGSQPGRGPGNGNGPPPTTFSTTWRPPPTSQPNSPPPWSQPNSPPWSQPNSTPGISTTTCRGFRCRTDTSPSQGPTPPPSTTRRPPPTSRPNSPPPSSQPNSPPWSQPNSTPGISTTTCRGFSCPGESQPGSGQGPPPTSETRRPRPTRSTSPAPPESTPRGPTSQPNGPPPNSTPGISTTTCRGFNCPGESQPGSGQGPPPTSETRRPRPTRSTQPAPPESTPRGPTSQPYTPPSQPTTTVRQPTRPPPDSTPGISTTVCRGFSCGGSSQEPQPTTERPRPTRSNPPPESTPRQPTSQYTPPAQSTPREPPQSTPRQPPQSSPREPSRPTSETTPGISYTSCRGVNCGGTTLRPTTRQDPPPQSTQRPTRQDPPPQSTRTQEQRPTSQPQQQRPTSQPQEQRPTSQPQQQRPTSQPQEQRPTSQQQRPTQEQPRPTSQQQRPTQQEQPRPTSQQQRPTQQEQPRPTSQQQQRPTQQTQQQRPTQQEQRPTQQQQRPSQQTQQQRPTQQEQRPTQQQQQPRPTQQQQQPRPTQQQQQPTRGGGSTRTRGNGEADGIDAVATPEVRRRALAAVADITSTVYETTYTITTTTTYLASASTVTENSYMITTVTYAPPLETVCTGNPNEQTITVVYQAAPVTAHQVEYVTYNTWVTVWVGQTQYTTATDYNAMTQCWHGGGYYGV